MTPRKSIKLTNAELKALLEACAFRTAGEMDELDHHEIAALERAQNALLKEGKIERRNVEQWEFERATQAIWGELDYQNNLPRRTSDEAKDVPGFLTLLRRYVRKTEEIWADNPGQRMRNGDVQVEEALHCLRKLGAIIVRAMIYNGIAFREPPE